MNTPKERAEVMDALIERQIANWDAEIEDDIASADAYGDWMDGTAEWKHDEALLIDPLPYSAKARIAAPTR